MELPKTSYKETQVNKVNQGTYFKLKPTDTAPVWVRDHYDKSMLAISMMTQITKNFSREKENIH